MIRVVCTLLFIVGCFGQQTIVLPVPPTDPDIPMPPTIVTNIPSAPSGVTGAELLNSLPVLPQAQSIPSGPEVVERPCRTSDMQCIRRYFLHNSKCKPAVGRAPDPIVLNGIANRFYPSVNITQVDLNPSTTGLNNGRIQEFYINRATDTLVLGIEFRNLVTSTNHTFFRYQRRGREPIITHGFSTIGLRNSLGLAYITVTIPQVENLRLDMSDTFGVATGLTPNDFTLDPSLGQSSDPLVPATFAALFPNLLTVVNEYLLTTSPFVAATYIQYVICDFGLNLG